MIMVYENAASMILYFAAQKALKFTVANPVTAAAGTILVLRYRAVLAAYMFTFTLKIVGMTGRTERRVLGPSIRNHSTYRTTVTSAATRLSSVPARVVSVGVVTEIGWRPAVGAMTYVALYGRHQVVGNRVYLAGRDSAVVTAVAVTDAGGVMSPGTAGEGCGGMAG